MNKAIVTGATGLVGAAVARHLAAKGVEVLCLGRQRLEPDEIAYRFGSGASYLSLTMEKIDTLPERAAAMAWGPDDETVFFHFAWSGRERLADGGFDDQSNNAVEAAEAVRTAKRLGCTRFINAGTIEETFVEEFLEGSRETPYRSGQTDYALAKLAARDMCRIVAYLEKIDYIHTRLSVPLAPDLSRGTYIASTLSKIVRGKAYEAPRNEQLFDIVLTDDVARAYHLIGQKGRNKSDYFIGTSRPATLKQYFAQFEKMVQGADIGWNKAVDDPRARFFDTQALYRDTGFAASAGFREIIQRVLYK